MRKLADVLSPKVGSAIDGWILGAATAISADGLTIVGYGRNPSGNEEAWVAHLGTEVPEPVSCTLLASAFLTLGRRTGLVNWPLGMRCVPTL
jgi:hypothetical protein